MIRSPLKTSSVSVMLLVALPLLFLTFTTSECATKTLNPGIFYLVEEGFISVTLVSRETGQMVIIAQLKAKSTGILGGIALLR
jgi:hypothetical protein